MAYAAPVLLAAFVWWFATGLLVLAGRGAPASRRVSMAALSALAIGAIAGLWAVRGETTAAAAYASFLCGLAVWAWHELAFLLGYLTGPRRTPCPPGATGWRRFRLAAETLIHHEIAIAATALGLVALTWGADNQTGVWAFVILWAMRVSAKLNVFLGVRNLSEEFLPDATRYLATYFARRPMNALFPFVVAAAAGLAGWLITAAAAAPAGGYGGVSLTLLATLTTLAVIEHAFMVLPLPASALWRWSLGPADTAAPPSRAPIDFDHNEGPPQATASTGR